MEAHEKWINEALEKEILFSKSDMPSDLLQRIKSIPFLAKEKIGMTKVILAAASIALLISLNIALSKANANESAASTVYETYFSDNSGLI